MQRAVLSPAQASPFGQDCYHTKGIQTFPLQKLVTQLPLPAPLCKRKTCNFAQSPLPIRSELNMQAKFVWLQAQAPENPALCRWIHCLMLITLWAISRRGRQRKESSCSSHLEKNKAGEGEEGLLPLPKHTVHLAHLQCSPPTADKTATYRDLL